MIRNEAVLAIVRERGRQERLLADGRFTWTCASPEVDGFQKLAVLLEEVAEVGAALLERQADGAHGIREELVQVAAVALGWLESL